MNALETLEATDVGTDVVEPKNDNKKEITIHDLLRLIEPRWHAEFRQFMRNGSASPELMEYLKNDPNGQEAVDLAFEMLVEIFEEV